MGAPTTVTLQRSNHMSTYQHTPITDKMIARFRPTRLYIKRHAKTNLCYFGKTSREDIDLYSGSGIHWTRHLALHGDDVITDWVSDWFVSPSDIQDFALLVSETLDIVASPRWANMKPENGLDGGRMSDESLFNRITPFDTKVSCLYCKQVFHYPNFMLHHGDFCPDSPNRLPTKRASRTGSKNGRFISTTYDFYNIYTAEHIHATRHHMTVEHGIRRTLIKDLVVGKTKRANGWSMSPVPLFVFQHRITQETVTMTKWGFAEFSAIPVRIVDRLVNPANRLRSNNNWVILGLAEEHTHTSHLTSEP